MYGIFTYIYHMGVSKNTGTPKWMVKIMFSKPYEQMDDFRNSHIKSTIMDHHSWIFVILKDANTSYRLEK